MRLADAGWPQKHQVGCVGDESGGSELPDQFLVNRGLETEVELLQRPQKREVSKAGTSFEVSVSSCLHLNPEQLRQEVRVRELSLRRRIEPALQHLCCLRQPECLQVCACFLKRDHMPATSASWP
jgi:hypothetical protein